jgi:hypothetical protein
MHFKHCCASTNMYVCYKPPLSHTSLTHHLSLTRPLHTTSLSHIRYTPPLSHTSLTHHLSLSHPLHTTSLTHIPYGPHTTAHTHMCTHTRTNIRMHMRAYSMGATTFISTVAALHRNGPIHLCAYHILTMRKQHTINIHR